MSDVTSRDVTGPHDADGPGGTGDGVHAPGGVTSHAEVLPAAGPARAPLAWPPAARAVDEASAADASAAPVVVHPAAGAGAHEVIAAVAAGLVAREMAAQRAPRVPVFSALAERHVLPGLGAGAVIAASIGASGSPGHRWLAGALIAAGSLGVLGGLAVGVLHQVAQARARAAVAVDRALTVGVPLLGVGVAAAGVGCAAGLSWTTALMDTFGAAAAYMGHFLYREHRLQTARGFVAQVAQAAGPVPRAGALTPAAAPAPSDAAALPYGPAQRIEAAFAALRIAPVDVASVRVLTRDASGRALAWQAEVFLPVGNLSADAVVAKAAALTNNLRPARKIDIEAVSQSHLRITVFDGTDPLHRTLPWSGPGTRRLADPVQVGVSELGRPILLERRSHWLIGGVTGSGKSELLELLFAETLGCLDADLIGIDAKSGSVEFGPYREAFRFLGDDTPGHAAATMYGIREIMARRGRLLTELSQRHGRKIDSWDTAYGPWICLLIDELSKVTRHDRGAARILEDLVGEARAFGIWVWAATHTPSARIFHGRSSDTRHQFTGRIGMGKADPELARTMFGPRAVSEGFGLRELTLPGMFKIRSPRHTRPHANRALLVPEGALAPLVRERVRRAPAWNEQERTLFWNGFRAYMLRFAHQQPEGAERAAAPRVPGADEVFDQQDSVPLFEQSAQGSPARALAAPGGRRVVTAAYAAAPREQDGPAWPQLWRHMQRLGDASVDELAALGLANLTSRATVTRAVKAWLAAGLIVARPDHRTGRGRRFYLAEPGAHGGGPREEPRP